MAILMARWLDGWMARWLDGWLDGWLCVARWLAQNLLHPNWGKLVFVAMGMSSKLKHQDTAGLNSCFHLPG